MLCLGPACEPMLRGRAAQLDAARRSRTQSTLAAIGRGIEALRPIHGRKSLLLVSQGFVNDPGDRRDPQRRGAVPGGQHRRLLPRRPRAAVHAQARHRLGGRGPARPRRQFRDLRRRPRHDGLRGVGAVVDRLGRPRGGHRGLLRPQYQRPRGGAERIADESRVFYLLGFNASEGKPAQAWRKLQVTTKRSGLEVRARKGYTLAKAASASARPRRARSAVQTRPCCERSTRRTTRPACRCARAFTCSSPAPSRRGCWWPPSSTRRALGPGGDKPRRLEMSAVVRMRDEPLEFRYDQAVELKQAAHGTTWRAIAREFGVPPGAAAVRVVSARSRDRRLGSVSTRFEVPRPTCCGSRRRS